MMHNVKQDLVFCNPPPQFPIPNMDLHRMWFGRVLLFFKILVQTDSDISVPGQATEYELAFVDFFTTSRVPATLNRNSRIMLYAPMPQPRVYVIPVEHILGKLPVVPAGDTGKITDMPPGWFDADIRRSTTDRPDAGSAIWYVNEWALRWATTDSESLDRPRAPGPGRLGAAGPDGQGGPPAAAAAGSRPHPASDDSESHDSESVDDDMDGSGYGSYHMYSDLDSEADSDAGSGSGRRFQRLCPCR